MCLTRDALFVQPLMLSSLPQHLWQFSWRQDERRRLSLINRAPSRTDSWISPYTQDPRPLRLLFPKQFQQPNRKDIRGSVYVLVSETFRLRPLAISVVVRGH